MLFDPDSFGKKATTKKKCILVKWKIICQPKGLGGLRVANLATKNISLLNKWLFKLLNEHGVWQEILKISILEQKILLKFQAG
jgi:hypothetical protein